MRYCTHLSTNYIRIVRFFSACKEENRTRLNKKKTFVQLAIKCTKYTHFLRDERAVVGIGERLKQFQRDVGCEKNHSRHGHVFLRLCEQKTQHQRCAKLEINGKISRIVKSALRCVLANHQDFYRRFAAAKYGLFDVVFLFLLKAFFF